LPGFEMCRHGINECSIKIEEKSFVIHHGKKR
jgi:hypothetical protein